MFSYCIWSKPYSVDSTWNCIQAAAVTARACAPLDKLIDLAAPFLGLGAVGLFLKGAGVDEELTAARERFNMAVERHPSRSDPAATILIVRNVERHRTA